MGRGTAIDERELALPGTSARPGVQKDDGLGAHESVSEIVSEVFAGYTCQSIEVRRARSFGVIERVRRAIVFRVETHPRFRAHSEGASTSWGHRGGLVTGFHRFTSSQVPFV